MAKKRKKNEDVNSMSNSQRQTVKEHLESEVKFYSDQLSKATAAMVEYCKNPEIHEALNKVRTY